MSNDRCEKHGVTRCMLCNLKNPKPAHAVHQEMDKQAQEAAARVADTAPVEVDFGSYVAAEVATDPAWPEDGTPETRMETQIQRALGKPPAEPPLKITTHLAGNPIVDAAADYASAQRDVEMALAEINELKSKLERQECYLTEVTSGRDMKKKVLQALVGGAS
jgi:hypothetical protein